MRVFETDSEEATIAAGEEIAHSLTRPAVVFLNGELGAGKTTIVKGFAKALGAHPDEVSSPTFTLIHEYSYPLIHVDLYRLESEREFSTLGLEEYFDRPNSVVLIEWAGKFRRLLPQPTAELTLTHLGRDRRKIDCTFLASHASY